MTQPFPLFQTAKCPPKKQITIDAVIRTPLLKNIYHRSALLI